MIPTMKANVETMNEKCILCLKSDTGPTASNILCDMCWANTYVLEVEYQNQGAVLFAQELLAVLNREKRGPFTDPEMEEVRQKIVKLMYKAQHKE